MSDTNFARLTWKDITSFSQEDKERKPTCWEANVGGLRITITNGHLHCPGEWVMHCRPWFNTYPLKVDTREEAMERALLLVCAKVTPIYDGLRMATESIGGAK